MVARHPSERDASAEVLNTVLDALRDDPMQDVDALVRQHPDHEEEIRQLADVIRLVRDHADGPGRDPGLVLDPAGGAFVIDDFRLLREVGRGGMGIVYEAEQCSLGRRVALKILSPGVRLSTRSIDRFRREASAAGGLHHTNIVPVYATGVWEGVPYYAMQFIEGASLAQLILESTRGESLDPRTVFRWGYAIADALSHAHRHGVLHRDVKPSNILIDRSHTAWMTDFGLARFDAGVSITATGDIVGTVRYMAPEQARGGTHVDERADLYALGATLFEALCGRPVFEGDDRDATLRRVLLEPAPNVRSIRSDVPLEMAAIVDRLLEKEPSQRYPSAAVLAEDMRRALAGEALVLQPPGRMELARRFVQRHRWAVGLSTLAATVVLGFATGITVLAVQLAEERDRAQVEASRADRVNAYLGKILAITQPGAAVGERSMRDTLDTIVAEISEEFRDDARLQAPLRLTIARLYWQWGDVRKSRAQYEHAYHEAKRGFGVDAEETREAGTELASILVFTGAFADAADILQELDSTHHATMLVRGSLAYATGKYDEAIERAQASLRDARDVRSPDVDALHAQTQALDLLARSAVCLGRFDDAVAARREAVRVAEEPALRETEQRSQAQYYLAATLAESPKASLLAEAKDILVAEQTRLRARGEGDRLLSALNESILANLADAAGDVGQAEAHFREALRIKRRLYGGDHAEIATTLCNYAHFLGRRSRSADCLAAFDEAIAMYQSIFGPTHERTSDAITRRAKWADGTWRPDGV